MKNPIRTFSWPLTAKFAFRMKDGTLKYFSTCPRAKRKDLKWN